jgi:hypothetical protein
MSGMNSAVDAQQAGTSKPQQTRPRNPESEAQQGLQP